MMHSNQLYYSLLQFHNAGTDSSSRCRGIRNDILSLVGGGRSGDSQSELSPGRACLCESPLLPITTQDELSSRSSYNPEPAKDCRNEGSHTTLTNALACRNEGSHTTLTNALACQNEGFYTTLTNALACRNEGFYTTLTNALACRNEGSHTTLTNAPDWPVGTRDPIQP